MPSKRRLSWLCIALLVWGVSVCRGEDVTLRGVKRGSSYTLEISAAGAVTLTPTTIVTPSGAPAPTPAPTPAPAPSAFQKDVQALTQKALDGGGTKTTGAAISSLYSLVADSVADGSIGTDKAFEAVSKGTNTILVAQNEGAKWTDFRAGLSGKFTALRQEGKMGTAPQFASVFREVSAGMNLATGFNDKPVDVLKVDPAKAGVLGGIDFAKLLELLRLILEILKAFQ